MKMLSPPPARPLHSLALLPSAPYLARSCISIVHLGVASRTLLSVFLFFFFIITSYIISFISSIFPPSSIALYFLTWFLCSPNPPLSSIQALIQRLQHPYPHVFSHLIFFITLFMFLFSFFSFYITPSALLSTSSNSSIRFSRCLTLRTKNFRVKLSFNFFYSISLLYVLLISSDSPEKEEKLNR